MLHESDLFIFPELLCKRHTLTGPSDTTSVSPEWNSLLLLPHVLEVADGALKTPSVDGLSGFAGVLEGYTEVGATGASGFRRGDGVGSVTSLEEEKNLMLATVFSSWSVNGSCDLCVGIS